MTDDTNRPRGRPKGSGKDDSAALDRIADLLVANPTLKPTTAMKRTGVRNPSDIRRLQVKWKAAREDLLAAARKRKAERERVRPALAGYEAFSSLLRTSAQMEQIRRAMEGPTAYFLENERIIEKALGPTRALMKEIEERQRLSRQWLGPLEELRRMQERLNPWWFWSR